jgi:Flp pilus assembly pilin Flp
MKEIYGVLALFKRLCTETAAQDLAEYAIALGVIATGAIVAATVVGGNVSTLWSTANSVFAIAG